MSSRHLQCWVGLLALFVSHQAASSTDVTVPPGAQATIDRFASKSGITVVEAYRAQGGLIGVAARVKGNPFVFYLDESGKNLFMGVVLDAEGRAHHTNDDLNRFFPGEIEQVALPPAQPLDAIPQAEEPRRSAIEPKQLHGLPGISQHQAPEETGRHLYVLFDFGCSHCRNMYELMSLPAVQDQMASAAAGVTWIPVGFSGDRGAFKAAVALGKKMPFSELGPMFQRDWKLTEGGSSVYGDVETGAQALMQVMTVVRNAGVDAVPAIVMVDGGVARLAPSPTSVDTILEWINAPGSQQPEAKKE